MLLTLLLDLLIQIYLTLEDWFLKAIAWLVPDGKVELDEHEKKITE